MNSGIGNQREMIIDQFRAKVSEYPDRSAVIFGETTLSYRDLDRWSDQVAAAIIDFGVGAGQPVAVLGEVGFERVALTLGVFKAGAVFVPLSTGDSPERRQAILDLVGSTLLLVDETTQALDPPARMEILRVVSTDETPLCSSRSGNPGDLGYIVFTSGSTGTPKGIDVAHRSMIDYIDWTTSRFDLRDNDRVAQLSPFTYDISLWEVLWPLTTGSSVVLIPEEIRTDSTLLVSELALRRITHLHLTPPLLRHVVRERSLRYCRQLRAVLVSSDVFPASLINETLETLGSTRRLFHIYGVTESSVESSAWECEPLADDDVAPIGDPVTHTEIYLLNEDLEVVGPGGIGEIYIGGSALAWGYHSQAAATATAFIPNPFSNSGKRLYRTGDQGRRVGDQIVLYGRQDRRVKVRGHLVDLIAVESTLERHPDVDTAIAICRDSAQLDAYLVPTNAEPLSYDQLVSFITQYLPLPAIPNRLYIIDDVPQTWNGKVDRKRLAAMSAPQLLPVTNDTARAATEIEEKIRQVVAEALDHPGFGVEDDFFANGGHSLKAMSISERLFTLHGLRLPAAGLFQHRTVRGLVANSALESQSAELETASRSELQPLSAQQLGVWLAQQRRESSPIYNTAVIFDTEAPVDEVRMAAALRALVTRQETLRTRIVSTPEGPRQRIDPAVIDSDLRIIECGSRDQTRTWARRELHRPFDLASEWPFRPYLLRCPDGDTLLVVMHHLATDGVSANILVDEVVALYTDPSTAPAIKYGYIDVTTTGDTTADTDWWRQRLDGAQPITLSGPGDRTRPRTGAAATLNAALPSALSTAMHRIASDQNTTPFTVFHALMTAYLSRLTDEKDIVTAVPMSIRPPEAQQIVGHFIQTILTRINVGDSSLVELISQCGMELSEAFSHASVSTSDLAADRSGINDLLRVVIGIDERRDTPRLDGRKIKMVDVDTKATDHELELTLTRHDTQCSVVLTYDQDLFDDAWARDFLRRFNTFATDLIGQPGIRISQTDVLTEGDHEEIDKVAAARHLVDDCCIPCMITKTAHSNLESIAIMDDLGHESYASLLHKVRVAADRLHRAGLSPGDIAAVYVERSRPSLIAMLAVLYAGAVYLPIRADGPVKRLRDLCQRAGPSLLVNAVEGADYSQLAPHENWIDLTVDGSPRIESGFHSRCQKDRAAYLLFTSGTTGTPNGVMVSHRSLVNRLAWAHHQFGYSGADVHIQKTALDFDVSIAEILQPLTSGGTLVLPSATAEVDPSRLATELTVAQATVVHFVPSALRAFLEAGQRIPSSVRLVQCSGEGLPRNLVDRLRETHPAIRIENTYGPTETTIETTAIGANGVTGKGLTPIGNPIWNSSVEVLDSELRRVPAYTPGELYIGGEPPAVGYLGLPALTATKFVPDPYSSKSGARMYASGDIGYRDRDGVLHFLDRVDRQIQVRGHRIELGAVEAALNDEASVHACAVIADFRDDLGHSLVAYVHTDGSPLSHVRHSLSTRLPKHFIPDRFVEVTKIPLTPSGKLDRRAIAAYTVERAPAATVMTDDEPLGTITAVFADLIGVEHVDPNDDFFAIGGHSILAVRVAAHLSVMLDVKMSPVAVFDDPTPAALARTWSDKSSTTPKAPSEVFAENEPIPLLSPQRGMWISSMSKDSGHDDDLAVGWLFPKVSSSQRLIDALAEVISRNGILRTSFELTDEGPVQIVNPGWLPALPIIDDPRASASELGTQILKELRARPFDLTKEPCLAAAAGVSAEGAVAVVNAHHILMDGWSIPLLLEEIHHALENALGPPRPQYREQVAVEASRPTDANDDGLRYWQTQLAHAQELALPGPPPRHGDGDGQAGRITELSFDTAMTDQLESVAKKMGGTLYCVLYAVFSSALHCLTGQRDLVVGADAANRLTRNSEQMIGFFVNQLPLRIQLDGKETLEEMVRRSVTIVINGLRYQSVPFEDIIGAVNPPRHPGRTPFMRAKLVLQNLPTSPLSALHARELNTIDDHAGAKVDLQMVWEPHSGALRGHLEWATDTVSDAAVLRFVDAYRAIAKRIIERPQISLHELARDLEQTAVKKSRRSRQLRRN